MLNVQSIGKAFGGEVLFSGISFQLKMGDRIGLIGKNGAGKSTVLKILANEISADEGTVSKEKGVTIGVLKQDLNFSQTRTVLDETYEVFEPLRTIEQKVADINDKIGLDATVDPEYLNPLLEQLDALNHRYQILGGYEYRGETEKILLGLGFSRSDFDKKTNAFSGGWRMRIELAKLLLGQHNILLLDEPTNHLDIQSIIWLENHLKNYHGIVVLVSHDKMFLDQFTNRIIEITNGKIYDMNKSYSDYLIQRQDIIAKQTAAKKNQEKQIQHTEKLIEKFRYKASKASMAQSLIKKLDKIERIEVDEIDEKVLSLKFPVSLQPGKVILEMEDVSKSFGDKKVLEQINIIISRGTKTAFVGQNGKGKTTLAKIIVKELSYGGKLKYGHNVEIGYFAQDQSDHLDDSLTLLESMENEANDSNRKNIRQILGMFLFSGDDVDKKVSVLSGGERSRLAFAMLMLKPLNVLVLDEPTNHLDIPSKRVLKKALKEFDGTIILISHDRDFMTDLCNRVFEFSENGIKEFPGDVTYYLSQRQIDDFKDIEIEKNKIKSKPKQEDNNSWKAVKKLKNKISKAEFEISKLEKALKTLEKKLAVNPQNQEDIKQYDDKHKALNELMARWEEMTLEYEGLKIEG